MPDADAQQVHDLQAFAVCRDCGYSLLGHSADGVCPECGKAYKLDPHKITLFGTARGAHATLANAKLRHVWFPFIALAGSMLPFLMLLWHPSRVAPYLPMMCLPLVMILFAYPLWMRFRSGGPSLIEVHLTPHGCGQNDSPRSWYQTMTLMPWRSIARVALRPSDGSTRRLTIKGKQWFLQVPVDADVELTDQQAAALLRRIERWRLEADSAWRR